MYVYWASNRKILVGDTMELSRGVHSCARVFLSVVVLAAFSAYAVAQQEDNPDVVKLKAISEADTMVMVPMRDGVGLATDVYLPKGEGPFPVIFVKTPYNFNKISGGQLDWAIEAMERGYAFVVQNERGRYYSEGEWEILGRPRTDGFDSLTWLAEQEWSTGKVSTMGCSSTAEWQLALAAQNHPAHAAMVPMASGAGIGRVDEYYEQGNWYKGGVHQTLFTVWLYGVQQNIRPQFPDGLSQEQLQRLRKSYDLAAKMPEKVAQLNALIDGFIKDTGALAPKPNPAYVQPKPADPTTGLVARMCKITLVDGALRVEADGPTPFLGTAQVRHAGPMTLKLRARSAAGGPGKVWWKTVDQEEFPPEDQIVEFTLAAGDDWQEIAVTFWAGKTLRTFPQS